MVPVFQSLETISGEVSIAPVPDKRIEHMDVKIELLGQIGGKTETREDHS